jgi:hypothetical protein
VVSDGDDRNGGTGGEIGNREREFTHHVSVLAATNGPTMGGCGDHVSGLADRQAKRLAEAEALFFVPGDCIPKIAVGGR